MDDPKLTEAVRIVREIVRPLAWARERWSGHGWVRDTRPADALDAVLAALERLFKEWDAVVAALGPHAHPGLSPSESVAEVVNLVRVQDEANREMTRLLAEAEAERDTLREKLSSTTEDYIKERNADTAAEAERDVLRATLTEETQKRLRAESEEQQQRTYARNCGEQLATLRAEVERRKALAAATQLECNRLAVSLSDEIEAHRTTAAAMYEFEAGEERAEAALIAIRAGSIRLAAAGIVGHLHVVEQCSAALRDPAPAEGFFARGDDGQYRTDPAPAEEGKP